MGASWAQLRASWPPLGLHLEPLGRLLDASWARHVELKRSKSVQLASKMCPKRSWTYFGANLEPLGANLSCTWSVLGASWAQLGVSWTHFLNASWVQLGASWAHLGGILGSTWSSWTPLGLNSELLDASWAQLGAQMLLQVFYKLKAEHALCDCASCFELSFELPFELTQ